MKIISVAAPCNGSGKTSLICSILQAFPGRLQALKCTTVYPDEKFCPASEVECACRRLDGDFAVIADPDIIRRPETDTAKIDAAGAVRTLWCLARPPHHASLWKALCVGYLDPKWHLLCEGNSLADLMSPDLRIVVVHPDRPAETWKDASEELVERADFVILNSAQELPLWRSRIRQLRRSHEGIVTADVRHPIDQWRNGDLSERLSQLILP